MTFPDQKFASPKKYVDAYFKNHSKAVSRVDGEILTDAIVILQHLYESGGTLYVCGNGGSASISNHLACDHGKLLASDTDLLPRVQSLAANIEVITAIANDISYDEVFVHQLRLLAEKGDVLMTISSSGNSEKCCSCCDLGQEQRIGDHRPYGLRWRKDRRTRNCEPSR